MALQRTLTHRLLPITRISSSTLRNKTHISETLIPPDHNLFSRDYISPPEPDNNKKSGFFKRFLQKRTLFQSEMMKMKPEVRSLPVGEKLVERIKGLNVNRDRLRFEGLNPNPNPNPNPLLRGLSVEDAKKLLKLSQLETLKSTLRSISRKSISYSEFLGICVESTRCDDQGLEFAKRLDESGVVIVLGNVVFLQPEQVAKAIQSVIPLHRAHLDQDDDRVALKNELDTMEHEKMRIDARANELVRRELWGGLGFFVLQTATFMRLTFWELSWDVMEPICFFFTSAYAMAGYTFFLRTSMDPSFEGFYKSRFALKQKRLMAKRNFDVKRYNELKSMVYNPFYGCSESQAAPTFGGMSHSEHRTSSLTCALHH